jgi:hypothetical protein
MIARQLTQEREMSATYTVAVGRSWHQSDNTPAPDYDCGHKHRTVAAAKQCGEKLYGAGYLKKGNGSWQANATWHDYYVIDNATGHKVRE